MTVTRTTSLLLLFLVPSFILGNPVLDEPEETLLLDSSDDSDDGCMLLWNKSQFT